MRKVSGGDSAADLGGQVGVCRGRGTGMEAEKGVGTF